MILILLKKSKHIDYLYQKLRIINLTKRLIFLSKKLKKSLNPKQQPKKVLLERKLKVIFLFTIKIIKLKKKLKIKRSPLKSKKKKVLNQYPIKYKKGFFAKVKDFFTGSILLQKKQDQKKAYFIKKFNEKKHLRKTK